MFSIVRVKLIELNNFYHSITDCAFSDEEPWALLIMLWFIMQVVEPTTRILCETQFKLIKRSMKMQIHFETC